MQPPTVIRYPDSIMPILMTVIWYVYANIITLTALLVQGMKYRK